MIKKKQNQYFNYLLIKCFLLILFFFISKSFSQNRVQFKKLINSPISKSKKIQKADSLITIFESNDIDSLPYIYNDYAYWLFDNNEIKKTILHEEKALVLSKKKVFIDTAFVQRSASSLGFYYSHNNQLQKSIDAYLEVIRINNKTRRASITYLTLADVYDALQDYHKAYKYYELAISLLINSQQDKHFLRNAYQNLTFTCYSIKTKESLKNGRKFGRAADSLAAIIETPTSELFKIKLNLALMYNEEKALNFNSALHYYNEALQIAKKAKDSIKTRRVYQGLGDLYNIFDHNKSIEFYNKSIEFANKKDTLFLSDVHYGLGHTYSFKKDYDISLNYRHKALDILTRNNFLNPKEIDSTFLINFQYKRQLLINLQELAQTYLNYHEDKKDVDVLEKVVAYFKMCDTLIDALKADSSDFKSRLYWRELSTDIYGKAIRACYLNNNIEDAFYFMEKNKALLLLEDISNKKFKRALRLPPNLLEKSSILKKKITLINNRLYNENILTKKEIDSLKKQRIDLGIELSFLEKDIKVETLNIETSILSLQDVQYNLSNNEVIIEYHISIDDGYGILTNKDNGYVLFITKDDTHFFEIDQLGELKKEIITLINSFKTPFKTNQDIKTFSALSNTVFNKLFPSKQVQQLIKGKTVTIVPDNYLSLLPFETLSTSSDNTSYLIYNTEIHYLYSNSFLENTKKEGFSNNKSLAIAPINFKDKGLLTLNHSEQEINSIQNYYPGTILSNTNATKTNFLNALPSSGIIHIASHANAQDKRSPWIAFNDENITLEELYLTQNNASLVMLSGCNTSIGEQEIGEGVMSLARGFFYSGSQSVISSLWSIDDRITSEITNSFYKNLSDGQTKSKALHNAKLTYLNNHNLSEASPYYWASFILLGENNTLKPPSSKWFFYLFFFILACIILYFIKKNKP
ncbi:CHAT domain-containing protein [Flavobacteriaceae bacterium AU392]|nr:CHAT domain-containing protein [Flavobacteriaceae bacterium]RKM86917.1 CHAT domain-containing protein [Flavobacteriaceae bacterium AU392]